MTNKENPVERLLRTNGQPTTLFEVVKAINYCVPEGWLRKYFNPLETLNDNEYATILTDGERELVASGALIGDTGQHYVHVVGGTFLITFTSGKSNTINDILITRDADLETVAVCVEVALGLREIPRPVSLG